MGYILGMSNACPVEHGLLFERFTDPDRSEYPDIDIDICQNGRADVINYVREKYGHVAQIITFGRLKAKAAIKDVSRVFGLEPHEGQRLANLVPDELGITIHDALEREPDLQSEFDSNPTIRRILESAQQLEGHARHAGIHAAGVVVEAELGMLGGIGFTMCLLLTEVALPSAMQTIPKLAVLTASAVAALVSAGAMSMLPKVDDGELKELADGVVDKLE